MLWNDWLLRLLWKRVGIFGDNTPKSITLQKLENLKMIHIAFNVDIVSFFGEFSHCGDQKKNWKTMQKLPYFEGKRVTLPPYLDNKFLLVARTRQDSFSKSTLLFDSFFLYSKASPPTWQNWNKGYITTWPCHLHLKNDLRQKKNYGNSNNSPCKNIVSK